MIYVPIFPRRRAKASYFMLDMERSSSVRLSLIFFWTDVVRQVVADSLERFAYVGVDALGDELAVDPIVER